MWEPALSSPMSWNSMSCTTVPESQSSPESPECGRSAAEATSQTLKKSSAWIQNDEKKDEFYLKSGNSKQEFNLVAEGIRKMALLWQLVKNGTLEKGSVLFWDEPEANVNKILCLWIGF